MLIEATCELNYESECESPAVFALRPRSGWAQWVIRDEFEITPLVQVVEFTDFYGNLCQKLVIPKGSFRISLKTRAIVPDFIDEDPTARVTPIVQVPTEVMHYLLPSRYCQSDLMTDLAQEIIGGLPLTLADVAKVRDWISANIFYQYGVSNSSTSALDTAAARTGVCRDFAHLGIALCRSVNVPARIVAGFLHELKPMDLHAWYEVYVGGRWWTMDATQKSPKGNRIIVAYGRDAADVAISTTYVPGVTGTLDVTVTAPGANS